MKPNPSDKIRRLADDHRAVSPAVGVALLVAITVILAAVIGFVVLDTNTESSDAKNARLDFDGTTVIHEGGDSFNSSNVIVKVNGANQGDLASYQTNDSNFNTGDEVDLSSVAGSDDTITLLWQDPESDREVQIGKATVE